jgi:hypothetical protein
VSGFRLYPNPAADRLFIDLGQLTAGELNMKIYGSSGKLVKEVFGVGSGKAIDVSGLINGVYRVYFFNRNGKLLNSQWLMLNH